MTGSAHRVLIVEDEHHLAEGLRFNLEAEGFEVEVVGTMARPRQSGSSEPNRCFDVVVLECEAGQTARGGDRVRAASISFGADDTAGGRPRTCSGGSGRGRRLTAEEERAGDPLARTRAVRRSGWIRRAATDDFAGKTSISDGELRVGDRVLPLT